jgi:hypothetical protein
VQISGNPPLRYREKESIMSSTKDIREAVVAELTFDPLVEVIDDLVITG